MSRGSRLRTFSLANFLFCYSTDKFNYYCDYYTMVSTMSVVKVTRNYQITIPAEIRNKLGIKEGDYLRVDIEDDKIVIIKLEQRRKTVKLGKPLSVEDIEKSIERGMKKCMR